MLDTETGKFVIKEGKEVYPGMKREEFKKTSLYKENVDEVNKDNIYYPLNIEKVDGFNVRIVIGFSPYDDYLEKIKIEKRSWRVSRPTTKKIGRGNDFEYERSVKRYLDRFLAKQLEGNIEGGRELWFDFDWGTIKTVFHPYGIKGPADIKLVIGYDTYLFKPQKKSDLTTEEKFGWGYENE